MLLFFTTSANAAEGAPSECVVEDHEYTEIWAKLREASLSEGHTIGVFAEGLSCERALDRAIRSGPFPGVERVPRADVDRCVIILAPGPDGYSLRESTSCASPRAKAELSPAGSPGPARLVSLGWWLPVGGTLRWDERLLGGLSAVFDLALGQPSLDAEGRVSPWWYPDWEPSWNPKIVTGSDFLWSSQRGRLLAGLDLRIGARRETLAGPYLGARSGITWIKVDDVRDTFGFDTTVLSVVGGHKWISDGLGGQIGAGLQARSPLPGREGPALALSPVIELRVGLSSLAWGD